MSDIELAWGYSGKIEERLVRILGAEGRGLHEKISNIEEYLPAKIIRLTRYIASVRNKVAHENMPIDDPTGFVQAAEKVIAFLDEFDARVKARQEATKEIAPAPHPKSPIEDHSIKSTAKSMVAREKSTLSFGEACFHASVLIYQIVLNLFRIFLWFVVMGFVIMVVAAMIKTRPDLSFLFAILGLMVFLCYLALRKIFRFLKGKVANQLKCM